MNRRNGQKELDILIANLDGCVPRLLLHSCCAPCSSYVLEYLSNYFEITVYYYNPNIYPPREYQKRILEQQHLIGLMKTAHPVFFRGGVHCPEVFYQAVKGMEHLPEGSGRCRACFWLRLEAAAKLARAEGFDYFTTTLSISPHKNSGILLEIGKQLAEVYQVDYLPSDFKKKNGYKRSVEISAEYGMYRQDYCGCVYSLRDRILR